MAEDEMIERHHRLNRHELGQTLGDSEGQGNCKYAAVYGVVKSQTRLSNRTTANWTLFIT